MRTIPSLSTKKKVRDAQLAQYNYMIVIGDKEVEEKTVNIRTRQNEVQGSKATAQFIQELVIEKETKKIQYYQIKDIRFGLNPENTNQIIIYK